jgi:hypothetical protein
MQSLKDKAYQARENYAGCIICVLTHEITPHALPSILYYCLKPLLACLWIKQSFHAENTLYHSMAAISNEQKVIILRLPLVLAQHLRWIAPDIVTFADWDHDKCCFENKTFSEVMEPYQKTFKILAKLQHKKTVQLVMCHDVYQYDALQLAAVGAGFTELHTFGKSCLATLRLLSQQLTAMGQHLIVREGKTIKMYRFPVSDFDSTYSLLACLSVLRLLQCDHQVDFKKVPLLAYYTLQRAQYRLRHNIVGLLCHEVEGKKLEKTLSANHLGRAAMLTALLQHDDVRLFIYSPAKVNLEKHLAYGYFYYRKRFIPDVVPLPKININLVNKTALLFGKNRAQKNIIHMLQKQGCDFYPNTNITRLTGNKYQTYKLFTLFDNQLQPKTEIYVHEEKQMERLLLNSGLLFLKPTTGNNGENIFTVKKQMGEYTLKYYHSETMTQTTYSSIKAVIAKVKKIIQRKNYIIQEGVISAEYQQSAFDVRVLMVNDGKRWYWHHKKRSARIGSELSNYSQGGRFDGTDEILQTCFGQVAAGQLLRSLDACSYRMVKFMQCFYCTELAEMTFDFVVDKKKRFYLLETNAKPGLFIMNTANAPFDFTPTPKAHMQHYVMPHLTKLAKFLVRRWEDYAMQHPSVTLHDIKEGYKMSAEQERKLWQMTWQHILFQKHLEQWDDPLLKNDSKPRCVLLTVVCDQGRKCYSVGSGFGFLVALKQAIERLYVRYQHHVKPEILHIEVVEAIVFSRTVNLLQPLPDYQSNYGIGFDVDPSLCFSLAQIQDHAWVNAEGKFDYVKARQGLKYHSLLTQEMQRFEQHPIQKIIYFLAREIQHG